MAKSNLKWLIQDFKIRGAVIKFENKEIEAL